MTLHEWADKKREEAKTLAQLDVRSVTPSIRDFSHAVTTQKQALAVVAELSAATPEEGTLTDTLDLQRWIELGDAASVSAFALPIDRAVLRGQPDQLRVLQRSSQSTTPTLGRDLVLNRDQLYLARLLGTDATLLHAQLLSATELRTLFEVAGSMHMSAFVEVSTPSQIEAATQAGIRHFVVPAFDGDQLALKPALALLAALPKASVSLVRGPFQQPEDFASLRGKADGLWLCGPLLRAPEPASFLSALVDAAENG